jgi:hypothetical protein
MMDATVDIYFLSFRQDAFQTEFLFSALDRQIKYLSLALNATVSRVRKLALKRVR